MSILVQCTFCGATLRARDSDSGKTKTCPKCGKPVLVPGELAEEALPEPEPDSEQAAAAEEAEQEAPAEAPSQAEQEPPASAPVQAGSLAYLKWIAALVLLGVGVGLCVRFLPHKTDSEKAEEGSGVQFSEEELKQYRLLSSKAVEEEGKGNKEEAIRLYGDLIAKLEEMDSRQAETFGLKLFRQKLRALQTGKTLAQIQAEDSAAEALSKGVKQPAAAPKPQENEPKETPAGQAPPAQPANPAEEAQAAAPEENSAEASAPVEDMDYRGLAAQAEKNAREGKTEEAAKIYRDMVTNLEKLNPDIAQMYGMKRYRERLAALEKELENKPVDEAPEPQ